MKTVIFLLLIAGSLMWSLYKRFKRTLAETGDNDEVAGQYIEPEEEPDEVSEVQSAPYFTYEYETPKPAPTWAPKPQQAVPPKPQPVAVMQAPAFDLRQAVIYQTVLNNPYIDELNQ